MKDEQLISPAEAAAKFPNFFGLPQQRHLRYTLQGPAYYRIGAKIYYRESDIRAWIDASRVPARHDQRPHLLASV